MKTICVPLTKISNVAIIFVYHVGSCFDASYLAFFALWLEPELLCGLLLFAKSWPPVTDSFTGCRSACCSLILLDSRRPYLQITALNSFYAGCCHDRLLSFWSDLFHKYKYSWYDEARVTGCLCQIITFEPDVKSCATTDCPAFIHFYFRTISNNNMMSCEFMWWKQYVMYGPNISWSRLIIGHVKWVHCHKGHGAPSGCG
jgi:hypothetical protein